ncbi:MAG: hypothetical protein AVDCRST_MAG41-362 [uncultured Corynebacteriales bacterium]|uniref:Uncharacterized protein n=1 Tax=uncultured Mycobacteriales bacterium TaxID=581187 RepID=A0A6J4HAJ2_9ACTN|nr:MAG: hypothetical protein AVDCRST_MAG41-362 [uncultured Corynebacteriales bacterium]
MPVTIPTVAVDPGAIRAAAAALAAAVAAVAAQADAVGRTWTGLGQVYLAEETPVLLRALDPVRDAAELHRARVDSVAGALEGLADRAEYVIRQLEDLRAQAATAVPPVAGLLEEQAAGLLAVLREAERVCAAEIDAAAVQPASTVAGDLGGWVLDGFRGDAWTALWLGDKIPRFGASYLDTDLESRMLEHFTDGSGDEFVLGPADVAALRDNPAVRRAGDAIRLGGAGGLPSIRKVVLEGGAEGYRVAVDFKEPLAGGPGNPFDGSLGRAAVYFDLDGNFVGMSDRFDFSNGGDAVDAVNLVGGLADSRAYYDRAGVIEERPDRTPLVQPDAGVAVDRIDRRTAGEDPGDYPVPGAPR